MTNNSHDSSRRVAHWKPAYVASRLSEMAYARLNPGQPWLTRQANLALASLLKPSDIGLEFGSGRSTIWFARRMKHLTSVEHRAEWHAKVVAMLAAQNAANVTYELRKASDNDHPLPGDDYVAVATAFNDASLDFVLVDGAQRGDCAKAAIPKLRAGGLLVIDNVNWFLPSNSRSPNSRSMADGAREGVWCEVHDELADWRRLWTTNGVSDTAIFCKPCRMSV